MTFQTLLKEKGLTQVQLAKAVGVTQIAVSKWVRNVAIPTHENMKKIANALNVDKMTVFNCFA